MILSDYGWLGLLIFIPLLGYFMFKNRKPPTLRFPSLAKIRELDHTPTRILLVLRALLRLIALVILILAMARPQWVFHQFNNTVEGIDIMLALDVSGTMRAEDFQPENRLGVAKSTATSFIHKRTSDRIGLVVFGTEAFMQCPLTLDYTILEDMIHRIQIGDAGDRTAIGMALVTALNRLKKSPARTRIIILLTDGVNNAGEVDPISAAEMAKTLGIKIYTIGIGKEGGAPIPIDHPTYGRLYARNPDGSLVMTEIDIPTLKQIATLTNGRFFRATDENHLATIYDTIDQLEKSPITTADHQNAKDRYPDFLVLALIVLIIEIMIQTLFLVRLP